jgi:hypothetical protein
MAPIPFQLWFHHYKLRVLLRLSRFQSYFRVFEGVQRPKLKAEGQVKDVFFVEIGLILIRPKLQRRLQS